MLYQQAAHLDLDWQHTFAEDYQRFVGDIFVEAAADPDQQPRAYYSVTEMGYLSHHLDEHPEELAPLMEHAARRRRCASSAAA